jgi:hypothetical protein
MIAEFALRKLTAAGRKAEVVATLGAFGLAGAGFLTAAGWTVLARDFGSAAASAMVGAVLLIPPVGWGLVLALRRVGSTPRPVAPSVVTLAQVMLAFTLAARVGETLATLRGNRKPGS